MDRASAFEHRLDVTFVLRLGHAVGEERRDAREAFLVPVDDLTGLAVGNAEPAREPEGGDAVDDPEVDHLRAAALLFGDLVEFDAVDLGGDGLVDVLPLAEGVDERLVLGQVRQQTQLDLRIVRADKHAVLRRDKRFADFPADVGADRDVLQVRVARTEPAGGGDGLVEARVDPAGLWVDVLA